MNTTSRILGEAMTPYQKRIYKDPQKAYSWANKRKQRFPEAEAAIATDPELALLYVRDVIRGRWPEAEPVIATDPELAYIYVRDVIRGRWPEGEPAIATSPYYSKEYLELFPQARLEFAMNGWIDWLDL